jgi:hypothetical protein
VIVQHRSAVDRHDDEIELGVTILGDALKG